MQTDQSKKNVEKAFWNSWGILKSGGIQDEQKKENSSTEKRAHRDETEFVDRIAHQQAEERRKENLKLFIMVIVGILAVCLIVFVLGLIDLKPDVASSSSETTGQSNQETPEMIEASIQEEMAKGGFSSKEAYFSSEIMKQTNDVDKELVEFSKRIQPINPKMNITSLVIAKKMDQLDVEKTINGFGIEVIGSRDGESDDVRLISHLKGMTSSVEFYAEGGRVVAHFKDYPPSYCAGTNGAAVCGS